MASSLRWNSASSGAVKTSTPVQAALPLGKDTEQSHRYDKSRASFYEQPPSRIPFEARRLLEVYSSIPPDRVITHIVDFRDQLWRIFPWPCVGQFRFVQPTITRQETYPRIVDALKNGARYLDVGAATGQDMRQLVLDRCPSTNMYVLERMGGYVDTAYDLWGDRETLETQFIIGDLFDTTLSTAQALVGTVDIIHLGLVLHTFELEKQVEACMRVCEFLKPRSGALIAGSSVGRMIPGFWEGPNSKFLYKHSVSSFNDMWKEISRRTNKKWRVNAWEEGMKNLNGEPHHWSDPLSTMLFWQIEHL